MPTPQYGWRYQALTDQPHGPNLGAFLALDAEATVSGIDTRLAAAELVTAEVGPGAVARQAAGFVLVTGANTDIPLDTEVYDSASMFAPTSALITIPAGGNGLYQLNGWLYYAATGANVGWRRLAMSVNGGTTLGVDSWHVLVPTPTGADCGLSISIDAPLIAGDTVRLKGWHTQGVSLTVNARLSVIRRAGL